MHYCNNGRPERGASMRSKFPFMILAYQSRAVDSSHTLSIHSTNFASNFFSLKTFIKSKKKVSKMFSFHNFTFHLNYVKIDTK